MFIDGDELQDDEHVNLNVRGCATTTTTTTSGTATSNGSTTVVITPPTGASGTDSGTTIGTTSDAGEIVFESEEQAFTQSPLFWVVLALANLVVLGVIVFVLLKVLK